MIGQVGALLFSPAGKLLAGLALSGALIGGAYMLGRHDGRAAGRVDQLADTVAAYAKRQEIDHAVADLDAYRLCLELGGLPDQCDQLRRMATAAKGE